MQRANAWRKCAEAVCKSSEQREASRDRFNMNVAAFESRKNVDLEELRRKSSDNAQSDEYASNVFEEGHARFPPKRQDKNNSKSHMSKEQMQSGSQGNTKNQDVSSEDTSVKTQKNNRNGSKKKESKDTGNVEAAHANTEDTSSDNDLDESIHEMD